MSNLTQIWEIIKDAVSSFGLLKGIFLLFFWVAHLWIYRLYQGRLADRQKQIDQIAAENREYRERFLTLLDRHLELERAPEKVPEKLAEKGNGQAVQNQIKPAGDTPQLPPSPKQEPTTTPVPPGDKP